MSQTCQQCFGCIDFFLGKEVFKKSASLAETIHMPSTVNDYDCQCTLHNLNSEAMLVFGISIDWLIELKWIHLKIIIRR